MQQAEDKAESLREPQKHSRQQGGDFWTVLSRSTFGNSLSCRFTRHLKPDIKTEEVVDLCSASEKQLCHRHVEQREETYTFRSPGISLHAKIPFPQLYGVVIAQ